MTEEFKCEWLKDKLCAHERMHHYRGDKSCLLSMGAAKSCLFHEEEKQWLDVPDFLRTNPNRPDHEMTMTEICERQHDWVERMGRHNKTVLEALALVASEVGEAVNECRGELPSCEFRLELADIILRVADLAQDFNIDLNESIREKMAINEKRGTRGRKI